MSCQSPIDATTTAGIDYTRCRLKMTLRFSKNDAVDIGDPDTLVSSQQVLVQDYFDHCSDAQSAARKLDVDIQDQAVSASVRAVAFRSQIKSLSEDPAGMAKIVKKRASAEPDTGKCDAILVTPGSVGATEIPVAFNLVKRSQSTDKKTSSDDKDKQSEDKGPSGTGSFLSPPPTTIPPLSHSSPLTLEQISLLDNPLGVVRSESSSACALEMPDLPVIDSEALLLPELLVEHKKRTDRQTKALNQDRVYLVSAVKFLAATGIKGHPIFGLVTSGTIGSVIMAWHSSTQNVCTSC
jgi:hypothetical protein